MPGDLVVGTGDFNFDYRDDSRARPEGGISRTQQGHATSSYQVLGLDGVRRRSGPAGSTTCGSPTGPCACARRTPDRSVRAAPVALRLRLRPPAAAGPGPLVRPLTAGAQSSLRYGGSAPGRDTVTAAARAACSSTSAISSARQVAQRRRGGRHRDGPAPRARRSSRRRRCRRRRSCRPPRPALAPPRRRPRRGRTTARPRHPGSPRRPPARGASRCRAPSAVQPRVERREVLVGGLDQVGDRRPSAPRAPRGRGPVPVTAGRALTS